MEEAQISKLPKTGDTDKTNKKVRVQKWFNIAGIEANVLIAWVLMWAGSL